MLVCPYSYFISAESLSITRLGHNSQSLEMSECVAVFYHMTLLLKAQVGITILEEAGGFVTYSKIASYDVPGVVTEAILTRVATSSSAGDMAHVGPQYLTKISTR